MGMAVWGLIHWGKSGNERVNISRMNTYQHLTVIAAGALLTAIVFMFASQFFQYDLVLLDITLTVFSLITTYLTVIKKLESWVYWSVINIVSIVLLYDRALYFTTVLMIIYLILACRGLLHWLAVYRQIEAKHAC